MFIELSIWVTERARRILVSGCRLRCRYVGLIRLTCSTRFLVGGELSRQKLNVGFLTAVTVL
jgi:hypothetical protein